MLPKLSDPRLKLSGIVLTLALLGQTILSFKVSVAQILVSILLCAVIEMTVALWRENVILWPASAIQTGVSVTFIFRAAGTRHGDPWSLNGIQYFVLAVGLSLLSKYIIRLNGRHVFNPSNFGIVWCLLLLGAKRVFSEHLWCAPIGFRPPTTTWSAMPSTIRSWRDQPGTVRGHSFWLAQRTEVDRLARASW